MTQAPTKTNALTIKSAADRLQRSLKNLEVTLEPILERVKELEQANQIGRRSDEDRSRQLDELAGELNELQAKHDGLLAREQEFSKLAGETTRELDAVISQVLQALEGEG